MSPTVHNSLKSTVEFKADMNNLYIRACKDPRCTWVKLPFIVMEDSIFVVMESWPLEWCALDLEEMEKITKQQQKKDAKLCIAWLVEKGVRNKRWPCN